jgi:hypothetical protein
MRMWGVLPIVSRMLAAFIFVSSDMLASRAAGGVQMEFHARR